MCVASERLITSSPGQAGEDGREEGTLKKSEQRGEVRPINAVYGYMHVRESEEGHERKLSQSQLLDQL